MIRFSCNLLGWVGLGCRFKANCPLVGPGPVGDVPSVEVFLSTIIRKVEQLKTFAENIKDNLGYK